MIANNWRIPVACLLVAGIVATTPAADTEPTDEGAPREIGLTERAGRRLAQLDVTVRGKSKAIAELTRDDFELVVGGKFIDDFLVDNLCSLPAEPPKKAKPSMPADTEKAEEPPRATPPRPTTTYLFYFDQGHLTMEGRVNSFETARGLIPRLIRDGNRGMIVSAGKRLRTFADLTGDPEVLLAALDEIEGDNEQFDSYAEQEAYRLRDVVETLTDNMDGADRAISAAKRYQREERFRTEKALRLFSSVLARLTDLDPPKAAVYFADTMRRNAGGHYVSFFGKNVADTRLAGMETDAFTGANPFDRLVEEASSHGIRIYTVQPTGLSTGDSSIVGNRGRPVAGGDPLPTRRGFYDAQDSLVGLAAETGGESFLNGTRPAKIAETIATDLDCLYLLSFDPGTLPEDSPLAVKLRTKRSGVKAHVRGQILLQSGERRRTSRLLAAFAAPKAVQKNTDVRGTIIPTGFSGGRYTALLQVSVPGSPLSGAEWDLGASLVSKGAVREDGAGHVSISGPGVPVVFEMQLQFSPGPFEVIMVAHETTADQVASRQFETDWPHPNDQPASVLPFAVLQPSRGAFLRDGTIRTQGAIGRDDRDLVRTDLPTALVGIVCSGRARNKPIEVERSLSGDTSVDFEPMQVELDGERCAQIRDLIPAGTMTEGSFEYEVRILNVGDEPITHTTDFIAVDPETLESSTRSAPGPAEGQHDG
ncbi:MAG: hypothetical protein GY716_12460 [bacterium]|nr:hypothetical protein [bacterium]